MKKLVVILLILAAAAFAQAPAQQTAPPAGQQPQAGQQPAQPGAPAQQQKQIKDPAEYNAYMSAVNQTDAAAKAAALESFLQQYPNSVMKTDALELLMASYQGNPEKTNDAANRLLQADPTNLRALAILAYNERLAAQAGQNPQQNLALAQQHSQAGMQALQTRPKPEGVSDADYDKLKQQVSGIFNSALGIAALQNKDYPNAQKGLRAAAEVTPTDFSVVYPLALAYLQAPQPDYINGLFYIARAVNLAPAQMQAQIAKYGQSQYTKYHGGPDGWDQVVAAAQSNPVPPPNFAIKPAPTPAEQAATMVQSKPVNQMSFGEFVFIFTSGNQEAADTVWNQIKDKPLAIQGNVISATPTVLMIAATQDDIDAKKPDIQLAMTAALTKVQVPKEGATIQFEGTPVSYAAQPSFLMQMNKGALLTKAGAKPAAKASPATTPRKRPPARRPPQ